MKTALLILITCTALLADKQTEAELRKQLAAAQAAQATAEARAKRLETGAQRLTEAVAVQAETTKQIEAVKDKIDEAHASDQKLAETVKSEAVATQVATKKLADVVTTQGTAVTSVISAQIKQQEKSLAEAREVARRLEERNRILAKQSEEDRIAKDENAKELLAARADIKDIKFNQALAAARDNTALQMQRLKLISDVATPFIQGVGGILLALVVVFQIKATRQASATHTMVNGQREKMLNEIEELKNKLAKVGQSE